MVAVIVSANNEYFYYGKEVFEEKRKFFLDCLSVEPYNLWVTSETLPDWDALIRRFKGASPQKYPSQDSE
jgi:hypothetical protein